jgi:tetratricopeptide (TPR) repeat protein
VRGDLDGAERSLTRSLHTAEAAHADLRVAAALIALGQIELRRDSGKATPYLERARAIEVHALGPDHPDLVAIDIALGSATYQRGALADAAVQFEHAIALGDRAVGHVDRDVANALANLALVRQFEGRADAALVAIDEALAIDAQVLPPGDPQSAAHLSGAADILEQLDRHADALVAIDRALAQLHALYGDRDHQDVADALHSRALIELATGKLAAALADARAALAMLTRIDPHLPAADLHRTLARIALARRDPTSALAEVDAARREPADAFDTAWLDGLYGRALVEAHRDRAHAIVLVTTAYTRMRADGRSDAEWHELADWMRRAGIAVPH